ncbi:DUF3168 domain-containing protein [uncultured Caulobacter sp.]|uniref:tail completion protein gp17 n=1 Tax=uncultured Caulobacter sp. TaxID=158749 RepID=UPI002613DB65|nr:DUF3168 domain-containing protein [uncultured Caulobacter sp.]
MTRPTKLLQIAVVEALLVDDEVGNLVAATESGPAVFARGQAFDDVYPRITLAPPQRLQGGPRGSAEMVVTLDSWAQGPEAPLIAAEVADAVVEVLETVGDLEGWRISSRSFVSSNPVGDPNPDVEHVVTTYRFTVHRNG